MSDYRNAPRDTYGVIAPGSCLTCRHSIGTTSEVFPCGPPGHRVICQLRSRVKDDLCGCQEWEREPGADDEDTT